MHMKRMTQLNGKHSDVIAEQLFADEAIKGFGDIEATQAHLDGNLPSTCRAEEQFVVSIGNEFDTALRKPLIVRDPPKEGVCIEQDPHDSNELIRSSGSNSSKLTVFSHWKMSMSA